MAILKDLIVHGPSYFIGKIYVNDSHIMKINGSDVPENPKFTDTVSSASTTGNGNAITSVNVNNGSFTFTKGSTFLTSQNTAVLFAGTSSGNVNAATTNGNTYLILQDGTNYSRRKISGADLTEVTSDKNGNISISTKFANQQANKFFGGPKSGSAAPSFRGIELEDLPYDTAITEGSDSQNLPTTQAVAAYVEDKIDNLQIGYDQVKDSNNLIIDGENPVLDPVFARPRIKGDENSYVRFSAGTQSVVPHGVKITSTGAVRPFITFGSSVIGEGTLCGLTPGSTYTFSCKLKYKLLSGGDTGTRYLRMYLMTNKADPSKFEYEDYITVQSLSTLLHGVELGSKGVLTFTVPLAATKVYLLIACNQSSPNCYTAGDYIEATEFRLEEGSIATLQGNKSDLKIGGRNYFAICNSVKGYLYADGTIHAEDTYKEYTCDYIPVSKDEVFTLSTKTLSQDDQPYLAYRFFDSEKNPFGPRVAGYVKCISNIEVPDGAAYIRASYRTHNGTATGKLELGSIPTDWTPAPEDLMEEIDTAKGIANTALQNIEEVETIASTALKEGPEFILGTHISNSSLWTGESRDSALFQGKTINYQLPYTGVSGSPTLLRLLLANGNTTGDIVLVDNAGNTISDQYPAGSILSLVYDTEGVSNPPVWRVQDTTRKIEEDQISISATNDTVPTSLAVKNTIDKLPLLGKNLLRRTGDFSASDFVLTRSTVQTSDILRLTPTSSAAYAKFRVNYLDYADFENKIFTVSLDVRKADVSSSYTTANNLIIYVGVNLSTRLGNLFDSGSDRYGSKTFTGITSQWQRVSFTFTVPNSFTTGKTAALATGNYFTIQVAESGSRSPIEVRHIKLEEGIRATDWTRAPDLSLDYVTPQMFGAYGDGEHDDTDAIQAALDESYNVFIPAGTYMISHSLIVRSKTHLRGESTTKTVIRAMRSFDNTKSNIKFSTNPDLSQKRQAFLTENETSSGESDPHAESYMIQIIQSIRASNSYCTANTRTVVRPNFAGDLSCFTLEDFTLDCNDVTDLEIANPNTNSNTPKALAALDDPAADYYHKNGNWDIGVCKVGGMHIWRPYDHCNLRNVYCYNTTIEGLLVGDKVSYAFMQKHYLPWIDKEPTIPDQDSVIPEEEQNSYLQQTVKMLRRRTRGQTLQIQNCHFLASKQGNTFNPLKYYDRSTLKQADQASGSNYVSYRKAYWRPAYGIPFRWVNIDTVYNFNQATSTSDSSIPSDRYNSQIYPGEGRVLREANKYGAMTANTITYTHNAGTDDAVNFTWTKRRVWANKWLSYQRAPLVYIYNCLETNLMNTKIMYTSSNMKQYPALVLDNCTDAFVRGCSFTGTVGPALRIVGTTNYYRLMGNTYELTGVVPLNSGVFTGGGFATMGVHNLYNTGATTTTTTATTSSLVQGNLSYKGPKGEAPSSLGTNNYNIATPLYTEVPYVIDLLGLPPGTAGTYPNPSNQIWKVTNGIIIESTYNNTPREVRCRYTKNTLLMGTFNRSALTSTQEEGTIIIDTQTGKITSDRFNTIKYDIATSQYSAVSSAGYSYRAIKDISSDIDKYGTPVGIAVTTQTGSPATVVRKGKELYIYTAVNNIAVSVTVKYEPQ